MRRIRIQIPDREACIRAFSALIRRGRIDCYRENVFVIPEPGLDLLSEMGVPFIELGEEPNAIISIQE